MNCFYVCKSKTSTQELTIKVILNMSASNNNNNKLASFELTEFNKNPPPKNDNKEKPKEDYTGFNHADFASWSKSSTEKEYKPFNQPQINADRQQQNVVRPDNEWFDYAAFITLAKSQIVQN